MSPQPFFVLTVARSGSTSLARILDGASNGCCAVEPAPNLNVESRLAWEGRLGDPKPVLERTIVPRVTAGLEKHEVYGEKNLTYGPFIPALHERLGCRFVFLHRDGRDVVRSLIDWHDRMFGSVYREAPDPGRLSRRAREAAANLLLTHDTSDYSRPRPLRGSSLEAEWPTLGRDEMCAWYWATANDLYRERLGQIPPEAWMPLDYSHCDAEGIVEVARFLGLRGLDATQVAQQRERRINSLADRTGEAGVTPRWPDWDGGARRRFERFAAPCMERLGYFSTTRPRWRPDGFGRSDAPRTTEKRSAEALDASLARWIEARERADGRVGSAARAWADAEIPVAPAPPGFFQSDTTLHELALGADSAPDVRAELVVSPTGLEQTFDVELFLERAVDASNGWVALGCSGWDEDAAEHTYRWEPEAGTFRNRVSPRRLRERLAALGCREIETEALREPGSGRFVATMVRARSPRGAAS